MGEAPAPIRLTLLRHPFSQAREVIEAPFDDRRSLLALAEANGMDDEGVIAIAGDAAIPRRLWPLITPKPGVDIILRRVPEGGSGKSPLAMVLSVVSFFIPIGWGPVIGVFGGTTVGLFGVLAKGALFLIGSALSRPPEQRHGSNIREPNTYQVMGGSNKVTPYGVIPRIYGTIRAYPPYAAQPYVETVGGKQYLNLLFDFGYGPLKLSDFRIGNTPLSNYTGVEMAIREGWDDDPELTLYRNDVNPQSLSILVKQAEEPRVIVSGLDADEATLGFVFQRGLVAYDDEEGDKESRTVRIRVDHRLAGSSDAWSCAGVQGTALTASSEVTLIDSTSRSKTYRTDHPVAGGAIGTVDLLTGLLPGGGNGISLRLNVNEGQKWAISTRVEGATDWTQQVVAELAPDNPDDNLTDDEPGVKTYNLVVPLGSRAEIHIEQYEDIDLGPFGLVTPDVAPDVVGIDYSWIDGCSYDYMAAKANPVMVSARIIFPARGQYEVRVTRITNDALADTISDEMTWQDLNSITYRNPVAATGHCLVALRIQATEQLNSIVQEFSAIATALVKKWDGAAWTDYVETHSPAWIYADILCGAANARPIARDRLDTDALSDWADDCATIGLAFNGVFDFRATVFEAARDVASTGRASFHMRDGLYSVAQDKAHASPVQHFTPRNSWGYSGTRRFVDIPHAIKVRFLNRERNWQQDERIVPDDGYTEATATRFEVLELFGVDNADQAWIAGRYYLAAARLRPEEHAFYADIEHIVCNRGDMIRFTHDVPLFGLGYGRVKTVTLNGSSEATDITLDAGIVMEPGKNYAMRLRRANGDTVFAPIATVAGEQFAATFNTPVAAADVPAIGDLYLFGESGTESVELLVTAIEPRADLSALIRAVDAAPAAYDADTQPIPAWNSQISLPAAWSRKPATPVIESVASDESVLILTPDGGYQAVIQAVVSIPGGGILPAIALEVRWRRADEGEWSVLTAQPSSPQVVTLPGVQAGIQYFIRARTLAENGVASEFVETTHIVIGAATPPPAVTTLLMRNDALIWSHAQPRDHAGYRVRYRAAASAEWDSAIAAHSGIVTAAPYDVSGITAAGGTLTFLVKAVDLAGNESATAASLTVGLGDPVTDNVLVTENYHTTFPGTITGGTVNTGVLQADSSGGTFWGAAGLAFWGAAGSDFWRTTYQQMVYECSLDIAATESGPGRVLLDTTIAGSYGIEYKEAGSTVAFWGAGAAAFWGTAGDDFWEATGDWAEWPGQLSPIPATGLYFRVTTAAGTPRGEISAFSAILDVPDVIEVLDDVSVSSAGTTRLPITATFRAITAVSLTLQDIATGARSAIVFDKDETNGPLVKAYDGSGTLVNASVDAIVQGY